MWIIIKSSRMFGCCYYSSCLYSLCKWTLLSISKQCFNGTEYYNYGMAQHILKNCNFESQIITHFSLLRIWRYCAILFFECMCTEIQHNLKITIPSKLLNQHINILCVIPWLHIQSQCKMCLNICLRSFSLTLKSLIVVNLVAFVCSLLHCVPIIWDRTKRQQGVFRLTMLNLCVQISSHSHILAQKTAQCLVFLERFTWNHYLSKKYTKSHDIQLAS